MSAQDDLAAALRLHQAGRLREADRLYRRVLKSQPRHADALHLWGVVALQQGNARDAVTRIEQALQAGGPNGDYFTNLGSALRALGRHADSAQACRNALAVAPRSAAAALNLGLALGDLGQWDEAMTALDRAQSLRPNDAKTQLVLGDTLGAQKRFEEAIAAYERALELRPGWPEARLGLAFALELVGRTEEAATAYEELIQSEPDFFPALWYGKLLLPVVYRNMDEVERYRSRWLNGIAALEARLSAGVLDKRVAAETLLRSTNFYLHYQGKNDLEAQRRYGNLVHRIARTIMPEFCRDLRPRRRSGSRRLRVGFASAFLHHHSINKTHGQFALRLDRERFEVFVFYLGKSSDQTLSSTAASVEYFRDGLVDYRVAAQAIRSADLDVLIYFDIGMDALTQLLVALRLAPVQVNFGGHPVTSGLPTIDYFLSSDLMEPEDADAHYSERLVRLPNLATFYGSPDLSHARRPSGLPDAGSSDKPVVYANLQSLFKLLPGYDDVYPRIAAQVPDARFWFIAANSAPATEVFRVRLEQAFAMHGLDAAHHCTIWPRLPQHEFYGLVQAADVVLDGWPWSGNNSTMEALACGSPVVTLPGTMMRFRHSAAILTRLGLPELIARDKDELVTIAARLGTDPEWRRDLSSVIERNKHRLFDDQAPIEALARFLESLPGT